MRPTAGATILPVPLTGVFSWAIGAGWGPAAEGAAPPGGGGDGGLASGLTAVFNSPACGWSQLVILLPWPSVNALQRIKIQSIVAQMTQPSIRNPSRIPVSGCRAVSGAGNDQEDASAKGAQLQERGPIFPT